MRHSIRSIPSLMAILCSGFMVSLAMADNDHHNQRHQVQAHLSGFNEVHFSGRSASYLAWRCLYSGKWHVYGQDRRTRRDHPLRADPTRTWKAR